MGELDEPGGLGVSDGRLVVAEQKNHRLSWFTPSGECTRTVGFIGRCLGQFVSPRTVVAGKAGQIVVADKFRLQVLRADGRPRKQFRPSPPRGCVDCVLGVIPDGAGGVYVTQVQCGL